MAIAEVKLDLARALWDAGRDRKRARSFAAEARGAYASFADRFPQPANQEALAQADLAVAGMH